MSDDLLKVRNALTELKNASLMIVDEDDFKEIVTKYNCVLLGEKFNQLGSYDLLHSLKQNFDLELTNELLLEYLPKVCKSLKMPLEGLQSVDKPGEISAYFIELH